jgi:hypothetical protein
MERQCRWSSNLEEMRDHPPQEVLWYLHGYERGPLIFPAGSAPCLPATRMGTIEDLLTAMQQALATTAILRQSMQQHEALIIEASMNRKGTTYSFRPVRDESW